MKFDKCTKIDQESFYLTLVFNTPLNYSSFFEKIIWLKKYIQNKKVHTTIICGEPMVLEFGDHYLDKNIISVIENLFLAFSNLYIEVYYDLLAECSIFKSIIDKLLILNKSNWFFAPEFYSPSSLKKYNLFIENLDYLKKNSRLSVTSFIICDNSKFLDKHIYNCLVNKFPDEHILMIPRQGEEELFYSNQGFGNLSNNKINYILSNNMENKKVSYHELLLNGNNNFEHYYCDIVNHVVLDMSGNVYSCLTGFSKKEIIFSSGDEKEFLSKFKYIRCPYKKCLYDDCMSVYYESVGSR